MSKYIKECALFITLIAFAYAGCKKESAPAAPETLQDTILTIIPDPVGMLSLNDIHIHLDSTGRFYEDEPRWLPFYAKGETGAYLYTAGFWIGSADDNNPSVNLYIGGHSNYTSLWDSNRVGVFHVNGKMLEKRITNWPRNYGAPVDLAGHPLLYGDEMLMACLKGTIGSHVFEAYHHPVKDLRIIQTVFAYKRFDLSNVIFVRYEMKNIGEKDLKDIYAGFYSDTDIEKINSHELRSLIGYDSSRGLSYTYIDPKWYQSDYNCISGFAFLESPFSDSQLPYSVSGHRKMERDFGSGSDFGELNIRTPVQAINALKALGNDGSYMINPVTQNPTKFAFTGDPVTGQGWTVQLSDTRNMICTGPFEIGTHQSKVVTVLWINAGEKELSQSLQKIKSQTDLIRSEKSLWQFPVIY